MIYYVLELQSGVSQGSVLSNAYVDDLGSAKENYHNIMAYAAKSDPATMRKHGALVLDENGNLVENLISMEVHIADGEKYFYYTIELQSSNVGGVIPYAYEDINQSESKWHDLMKVACLSDVRKHGAICINEDGFIFKSEIKDHSPEPEPITPDE